MGKNELLPRVLTALKLESKVEIPVDKITYFEDHPFKIVNDKKMEDLIDSIKKNGIITPVLVRPHNNMYEMISGHRRLYAAKILDISSIPAIIRTMDDDEATIAMVNANIQRGEWLPSEKAFAFKMKMDAIRHQGERRDLTCGQDDHKLKGKKARDIVAEESNVSSKSVQRYVRLTYLISELLELVDKRKLGIVCAEEMSYLDHDTQEIIYNHILRNNLVKTEQIKKLRASSELDKTEILEILNETQNDINKHQKIELEVEQLNVYFPKSVSDDERKAIIWKLIAKWRWDKDQIKLQK